MENRGQIKMLSLANYDAIMFDLDGTLVDTLALHYQAYAEVLNLRGLTLEKSDFLELVGPPAAQAIPLFVEAAGGDSRKLDIATLHKEKKARFSEILTRQKLEILPAFQLVRSVKPPQLKALVTSGNSKGAQAILANLGCSDLFDTIITGDDVLTGKPDPEPYVMAANRLNVMPQKCLALEDTADGLASARAAGMAVLDVTEIDNIS